MSKHRYRFIAKFHEDQQSVQIEHDELHHLQKVLRLRVGEEVELMDGAGHSGIGAISEITTSRALVSLIHYESHKPSNNKLHLAIGALKKGELEDILPSIIELGIEVVHVFLQESSAKHLLSESLLERLQKIVRSSSKQCKRAFFPHVQIYSSLQLFLEKNRELAKNNHLFFCDPDGSQPTVSQSNLSEQGDYTAVVGSEAGLSGTEVALLQGAGAKPVRLGAHILKARTAAIVASFWLQQNYG